MKSWYIKNIDMKVKKELPTSCGERRRFLLLSDESGGELFNHPLPHLALAAAHQGSIDCYRTGIIGIDLDILVDGCRKFGPDELWGTVSKCLL